VVLLPIIKRQQYVLIEEKGRPIFFLSWAWMSEEAERRYLTQETVVLPEEDWCNGDRMWFRDFIAPFGHAEALFRLVREEIFRITLRAFCGIAAMRKAVVSKRFMAGRSRAKRC
jgi:cytolysin-activating lysine-acyltransferase